MMLDEEKKEEVPATVEAEACGDTQGLNEEAACEKKRRSGRIILAIILAILMAAVIAIQPYASYRGGTAPYFILISILICLVVTYLLTL